MAKGYSDVGTKLYEATITGESIPATGFAMLVGIRSTSAKGGAPGTIENTELHEKRKSNIADREESPNQTYTYNHTSENYEAVLDVCGKRHAYLEVLPSGDAYLIVGQGSTWNNGLTPGALNEATLEIVCEDISHIKKDSVQAMLAE